MASLRPMAMVFPLFLGMVLLVGCGSNPHGQSEERAGTAPRSMGNEASRSLAPGFSLLDTKGNTVSLADFKGQVVFIDFWASWCPPCRISIPEVEKLYEGYQGKPVQVLGVNLDEDLDAARAYAAKKKMGYPVVLGGDSDVSGAYDVSGIPHFVLIDQEGRLVKMWSGFAPGMSKQWRAAIDSLLGA